MVEKMIIGLAGKAGSGKDTVRSIMEQYYGFTGKAFADPLRDMARSFLDAGDISREYMNSRNLKESIIPEVGFSYRKLVQTLGTEWGRSLNPDIWLDIVRSNIEKSRADRFVISDVRFPNEFEWIMKSGGEVWYIDRDVPGVIEHASESSLKGYTPTLVIDNNNDIESLARHIDVLLSNKGIYNDIDSWVEP